MMEHAVTNDDAILAALPELKAPVVAINPDYRPTDVEALRAARSRKPSSCRESGTS